MSLSVFRHAGSRLIANRGCFQEGRAGPTKSGELQKQSDHVKEWRSRYLILTERRLYYYENETETPGDAAAAGMQVGLKTLPLPRVLMSFFKTVRSPLCSAGPAQGVDRHDWGRNRVLRGPCVHMRPLVEAGAQCHHSLVPLCWHVVGTAS